MQCHGEVTIKFFRKTITAIFKDRPNRFTIICVVNGRDVKAYLPNPGRLWELLLPHSRIYLVHEKVLSGRNTDYTVVAVERDGIPIMLHTHLSNTVIEELLRKGRVPGLEKASIVRREIRQGTSRYDFLLNMHGRELFLEVKSCTLFGDKIAMFPDAVTDRGRRHLLELAELSLQGKQSAMIFLVQWPRARYFLPDYHTDLNFSRTLCEVRNHVKIMPLAVEWKKDLSLGRGVDVLDIPWDLIDREARDRGSYLIILNVKGSRKLSIGALGNVRFRKGFYIYAGSARKNLSARIERHRRTRKKLFWHIDYLRQHADFCAAIPVRASAPVECDIAHALTEFTDWIVPGFGSSDCDCESHLFGMVRDPLQSSVFIDMLIHFRIDRLESFLE